ncbi:unnamed protein product [Thlaspi arvense]|uniref:Uncharacterized protein n=1 Tax=Thlaspi arvense TaxID=13288 RepID=A0AAU9RR18_THLAR|nr:unnamed protein product [Thlaspi arvense]
MYFHGLSKKRCESYEESSKQNQISMVTLFGQQVYTAKGSQDTIDLRFPSKIEASDTNWFGKRSEKVIISGGLGLLDLNQTPVSEPVYDHDQCFFQDLNFPYTQEKEAISKKSGLHDVHEKDSTASPASCCTAEQEDSSEVIQIAAECLLHISAVSLSQSKDFTLKPGSRPNSSSQDQERLDKLEKVNEEPGRSCDSFELRTLGISETVLEDVCCVSSKSKDEVMSSEKEVGVKLRRGKRMKNFQKEILPGLLSLSRHEIREDINILETVLRSREYKKMQGKTRNNKGLTQGYVGRRRR